MIKFLNKVPKKERGSNSFKAVQKEGNSVKGSLNYKKGQKVTFLSVIELYIITVKHQINWVSFCESNDVFL